MNRILLTITLSIFAVVLVAKQASAPIEKSTTIVHIDDERFYVHHVEPQQTMYSIARAYGVQIGDIVEHNPLHANALMSGYDIKIPVSVEESRRKMSSRTIRKTFDTHQVLTGETMYSISRKYQISVETIIEDNPLANPHALTVGEKLLIRKKEQGQADVLRNKVEWEEYRDNLNRVAPDGKQFHIVEFGETLFSIGRKYNMGIEEIRSMNDLSDGLKAGAIIVVNDNGEGAARLVRKPQPQSTDALEQRVERLVQYNSFTPNEELRVALFLPLQIDTIIREEFAEFYNGFLIALDDIKQATPERHISVDLYNSGRDSLQVAQIVNSSEFNGTDLIIGPIYEEVLTAVLPYAEQNIIPVVSPLSAIRSTKSSNIFQMAPTADNRYEKMRNLLTKDKKITLIHTEKTDSAFLKQIRGFIGDLPVVEHVYIYEHQDVVRSLQSADSLRVSPSDLMRFIDNDEDNTIVVTADNLTDVDRVLAALASADINVRTNGRRVPNYTVVGNSAWSNYSAIDKTIFFRNQVVLFPAYYAHREVEGVKTFESHYIREFSKLPTPFSYRGYDAAMLFINGMYGDIERNMMGKVFAPLQAPYIFKKDDATGVIRNTGWLRINYKRDYTITVE